MPSMTEEYMKHFESIPDKPIAEKLGWEAGPDGQEPVYAIECANGQTWIIGGEPVDEETKPDTEKEEPKKEREPMVIGIDAKDFTEGGTIDG